MADSRTTEDRGRWHGFWPWFLGLLVIVTLGVRYAEPVRDGDLWWQMAYGRQLIENRTLVADHTAFTWTPADSSTIYCAWLAQVFLYLLHRVGDLPVLFAFRYACIMLLVLAVGYQARRVGVVRHPLTWLVCLLGVLMSQNAAFIKPEIFSYVFMTLTVLVWLRIKSGDERTGHACYLFPLLMLLWVNSHGGFIFGAVFLFVLGVGEGLNVLLSPGEALPAGVRGHFLLALVLSAATLLATPYGWPYPAQLLSVLFDRNEAYYKVIEAYLSPFDPRVSHFHYVSYMVLAGLLLVGLMASSLRRLRPDWAILLTNVAFAVLFARFLRATYFWAPVFSLTAVHLLAGSPAWLRPRRRALAAGMGGAIALLCVFLGTRAGFDALCKPYGARWLGFGISYLNPVEEAAFIKKHLSAYRLGNDYTSGGFLLWALWPDTKVMIDPRQFPFREWLNRYGAFHGGRGVRDFLKDHPFQVCCIRYECRRLMTWFLRAPDWRVAFYGPSAAVFTRIDVPLAKGLPRVGQGIEDIRSMVQALFVFEFTTVIQDWQSARKVLAGMKERFKCANHRAETQAASDWLDKRLGSLGRGSRESGRTG
jgi:hypothetical protein